MSSRWLKRRTCIRELLTISAQDEDEEALAIDRVLHGQNVIGKTAKTIQVDKLRFSGGDLTRIGTLERGSFGEVCIDISLTV